MSTPPCCVVYTTDETYLFPTLVSAIQARRFASRAGADVLICHFGVSKSAEAVFAGICAQEGIGLLAVDPRSVENATPMLSRLFLDRFVPDGYAQILYIDGDVRIVRSLDPLIGADVPDGHFLAANDPMTFMLPAADAQSRALAGHLASIGLAPAQAAAYFNTGELLQRVARNVPLSRSGPAQHGGRRAPHGDVARLEFSDLPMQRARGGADPPQRLPFHVEPKTVAGRLRALECRRVHVLRGDRAAIPVPCRLQPVAAGPHARALHAAAARQEGDRDGALGLRRPPQPHPRLRGRHAAAPAGLTPPRRLTECQH
jgi:hypothetical protein